MIQFKLPENHEDDDSENHSHSGGSENVESKESKKSKANNKGTLIVDATCVPQSINQFNEAGENLGNLS